MVHGRSELGTALVETLDRHLSGRAYKRATRPLQHRVTGPPALPAQAFALAVDCPDERMCIRDGEGRLFDTHAFIFRMTRAFYPTAPVARRECRPRGLALLRLAHFR